MPMSIGPRTKYLRKNIYGQNIFEKLCRVKIPPIK